MVAQAKSKELEAANIELTKNRVIIDTSDKLSQAYGLMGAGKLNDAEERFKFLLNTYEQQSNHAQTARAHLCLGDISLKRVQYNSAIDQYNAAIKILSRDTQSLNTLGQAYLKKGALYYIWGRDKQDQNNYSQALKNYQSSSDFYKLAKSTFSKTNNEVGVRDANRGFDDAQLRLNNLNAETVAASSTP